MVYHSMRFQKTDLNFRVFLNLLNVNIEEMNLLAFLKMITTCMCSCGICFW